MAQGNGGILLVEPPDAKLKQRRPCPAAKPTATALDFKCRPAASAHAPPVYNLIRASAATGEARVRHGRRQRPRKRTRRRQPQDLRQTKRGQSTEQAAARAANRPLLYNESGERFLFLCGYAWQPLPPRGARLRSHRCRRRRNARQGRRAADRYFFCGSGNWLACGVTFSMFGVTSASTLPMAQAMPPRMIFWTVGLVQMSSRWPNDV